MLGGNRSQGRGLLAFAWVLAVVAGACTGGGGGGGGDGGGAADAGAVTMLFPEPGQANVPIQPTFQWDREVPAASYELFVWKGNSPPRDPLASTDRPSYRSPQALRYATKYSWRVDAIEGSGARSTGRVQSFTTIDRAAPVLTLSVTEPLVVQPGEALSLEISVVDPADSVHVTARDVPAGAVWDDMSIPAPVDAELTWTPKASDLGLHVITFDAEDAGGLQAPSVQVLVSVADPFTHPLYLAALDGTDGVALQGSRLRGEVGYSVSGLGDLNGDGFADVGVAAPKPGLSGTEPGEVYVVYGGTQVGQGASLDLSMLNGSNGFLVQGIYPTDLLGSSISGAGDLDGDGLCDFVIGAPLAKGDGISTGGEAYVIFGSPGLGAGGRFDLTSLDGTNGFVLAGNGTDNIGSSVSGAGDVNLDGFDDLIVGAPSAAPLGRAYAGEAVLVFGAADLGTGGLVDLTKLDAGAGAYLMGEAKDDQCGRAVSGAGDFNGDGYPDILIGAPLADDSEHNRAGAAYLLFGGPQIGSKGSVDLAALDGSQGFVMRGIEAGMQAGWSVAGAGDLSGDGLAEIAIGRTANATGDGEVYVILGDEELGKGGELSLDDALFDGASGFRVEGLALWAVAAAGGGDLNGDGLGDLLVGASFNDVGSRSDAGQAYLIYGAQAIGSKGSIHVGSIDGGVGIALLGDQIGDLAGWSVSAAGDVNGDGLGDLLVGAVTADAGAPGSNVGETYLVYGRHATSIADAYGVDPPGDVVVRVLASVGDGSDASSPPTHLSLGWGGGKFASATEATLFPTRTGLFGEGLVRADLARVAWRLATDRTKWSSARLTLNYTDAQAAGLDEGTFRVLVSESRFGPWHGVTPISISPKTNRITVELAPADLGPGEGALLTISQ